MWLNNNSYVHGFVELLLSDGVDVGGVLLLEDDDGVSHLQRPAVHHVRNAEVPVSAVPGLGDGGPEVPGHRVSESVLLQVVGQPVPDGLLTDHLLQHVDDRRSL